MISIDTNVLLYSLNRDCPEYGAARDFMQQCAARPDVAIAELATRNLKDFEGFGFDRVFDPLG